MDRDRTAPVTVVARWQVRAEHLGDVLGHVAELRRASLAEPGCHGYEVFCGVDQPGTVLLFERYRDDEALDAHRQSAHYRHWLVERILPLLSLRQVDVLRPRHAAPAAAAAAA